MDEAEKKYLKDLLTKEFNKHSKITKIPGYCKKIIGIASGTGLGSDFVQDLKGKYLTAFNSELD